MVCSRLLLFLPLAGIIKYDLDFLVNNWQTPTCDVWEDMSGNDFFWNRMLFYKSLTMGSGVHNHMLLLFSLNGTSGLVRRNQSSV